MRVDPGKHDLQAAVRAGGKDTAVAARGRGRPASFELRRELEPEDNVGVATAWEMPGVLHVSAADCEAVRAMVRADPTYRADPQAASWIGKAIAVELGSTSTARPRIGHMAPSTISRRSHYRISVVYPARHRDKGRKTPPPAVQKMGPDQSQQCIRFEPGHLMGAGRHPRRTTRHERA